MKQTINDFINSIDTILYSRIRASKGDAECRRYLKEHLSKQLLIHGVSSSEVKLKFNEFASKQQDLDSEFVKIVNDNFWDLL